MVAGPSFYFRTAPTNARPTRVWVVGDSGTADDYARAVRDSYYGFNGALPTDLFLMLGDNAYGGGSDYEYQKAVFDMYPEMLRHTPLWPTLGNHDAEDNIGPDGNQGAPYLSIFKLPQNGECGGVPSGSELYYSFDYGNLHVVCMDSFLSDRSTNGPMLTWLAQDLAATEKDWIIAFWHHPTYSWGSHNSDSDEYFMTEMRERALPLLESYGVDLVLFGHSHVYERSFFLNGHYGPSWTLEPGMILGGSLGNPGSSGPYHKPSGGLGANRGTVYVVCGCSGEGGAGEGFPLHPAMALNHGGFGSLVIDVNGLTLTARFLRPSQGIEDTFTIDKTLPATIRPRVKIGRSGGSPVVAWPTSNPEYSLEAAENVANPQWQAVSGIGRTNGRQKEISVPAPEGSRRFFRLRADP
jgi:hypothetical protein